MLDKVLAILSLGSLYGFMGFVISYIAEPDLIIITVAVLAMAGYDFYRLNTTDRPKTKNRAEAGR